MYWLIYVIPALGSIRKEDFSKMEASLGYIVIL